MNMENVHTPEYFMKLALKEAEKARAIDEVPIGAVIVKDGKVIARAHNKKETRFQSYAHAELLAIQKATKKLGQTYLIDCDLYVTLEPCMMCTGAIVLSRINTIYYGTNDPKGGMVDSIIEVKKIRQINHHPKVVSGILKEECADILSSFFKEKRKKAKELKNQRKKIE